MKTASRHIANSVALTLHLVQTGSVTPSQHTLSYQVCYHGLCFHVMCVAVGIAYLFLACQVHKSRSVPSSCPAGAWPLLRMTRRCMAPAKDDTHKSERIWLKHEPYEGRSEVRCQMWGCGSGLLV